MVPLPADENRPLLGFKCTTDYHNVLIWWLAYKEARDLLNEPR
jgi:hypothetical protein